MIKLSGEYALSLFLIAKEQDKVEEFDSCLSLVAQAIGEGREYLSLLNSPALPLEKRLALIDEAFGSLEVEEVTIFIKLLCQKGQIGILPDCMEDFSRFVKEYQKRVIVTVETAAPLSEEQKVKLENKLKALTGMEPETVYRTTPSLIGGIRIRIGDTVLDGSLAAKLNSLKGVIKG